MCHLQNKEVELSAYLILALNYQVTSGFYVTLYCFRICVNNYICNENDEDDQSEDTDSCGFSLFPKHLYSFFSRFSPQSIQMSYLTLRLDWSL